MQTNVYADSKPGFNPSSNNNVNGFNNFNQKATSSVASYNPVASEPSNNRIDNNGNNGNSVTGSEAAATNVRLVKNQAEQRVYKARNISIEIQRTRLNKLRPYLERLKKPFEESAANLRLGDAPIIDAMLRCAEVSTSTLKQHLEKAYSKPAYLPAEDEVFTLPLEEPQVTRRDRRDDRNRNLRVELSLAASNYLSSIQRELTEEMGSQPDLNAVANALIDLASHRSRQIVLAITEHFEEVVKKQKPVS